MIFQKVNNCEKDKIVVNCETVVNCKKETKVVKKLENY